MKAIENGVTSVISAIKSDAFKKSGYNNWKKAMKKGKEFKTHQIINAHKEAVARYIQHKPSDTSSTGQQMNRNMKQQQAENRRMLLKILLSIRYLGNYFQTV